MKKRIMNVVNFVRGIEPRWETDLYTPVVSEIEVNKQYRIPATFLLQYDAMLREDFRQLFQKEKSEYIETGVWFENCRAQFALAEKRKIRSQVNSRLFNMD